MCTYIARAFFMPPPFTQRYCQGHVGETFVQLKNNMISRRRRRRECVPLYNNGRVFRSSASPCNAVHNTRALLYYRYEENNNVNLQNDYFHTLRV